MHTLLKGLEKIASSANIPMVVAGDLNSVPGSAPHSLLMQGRVEIAKTPLQMDPLNLFCEDNGTSKLNHNLQLESAYAVAMQSEAHSSNLEKLKSRLEQRFHEPVVTNITHDFKATLDYICYSYSRLATTALLMLPSVNELLHDGKRSGLPTIECPSDHVALMAEFEFRG